MCQGRLCSCGACCGLYNRPDRSRPNLERILAARTEAVARAAREGDEKAVRKLVERTGADGPDRMFPLLADCPLLGFIDENRTRIGCLVHPEATGGWDGRGLGAYNAETCRDYLCPSHALLSDKETALAEVSAPAGPWFIYGLAVTDPPFLKALIELLEDRLAAPVAVETIRSARGRAALGGLLSLKESRPFADDRVFLGLLPNGEEDPTHYRPLIPTGIDSRTGRILTSLGTKSDRLREGAELVEKRIEEAARLLTAEFFEKNLP